MSLHKDLPELVESGVITPEIAERIRAFYASKGGTPKNRMTIVFGIFGAILVGLGVILIIAHNWDELTKSSKTILAFVPLIISQCLAGYTILKKKDSISWRESTGVLLFFGIGASISLVSQVYHISGDLSGYLLTWMALSLPVIYLLRSSATSLLYLVGITAYVISSYGGMGHEELNYYLLMLFILPYYYWLFRQSPNSYFLYFHHWFISISLTITLASLMNVAAPLTMVGYMSLFGLFYQVGQMDFWSKEKLWRNAYRVIGSLGTIVLLLGLSFEDFWAALRKWSYQDVMGTAEFWVAAVLTVVTTALLVLNLKKKSILEMKPATLVYLLFPLLYLMGLWSGGAVVIVNILLFVIGLLTIREGGRMNNLGVLNYGVLIIAALVTCRFFDSDLSFVARGLLFVAVGIGFFAVNYWMLQKRKRHEL
ncbi:MAG TPA: DUF2157 domain-containing protein [Saprospiraceae bacterium]|nr:DUF2157 domain-containing protein [Saprospiraceae bacterium]